MWDRGAHTPTTSVAGEYSKPSRKHRDPHHRFAWVSSTAFGLPEEPEVWTRVASSPEHAGGVPTTGGAAATSSARASRPRVSHAVPGAGAGTSGTP